MSDTNEIRELVTLPIMRVSEYYDEVVERVSDNYDPYNYIEEGEIPMTCSDEELEEFDWSEEG